MKPGSGGPDSGFSVDITPYGRVTIRNMDLWNLIRTAYHLRDLETAGGPAWIKTRAFDIQAQPAAGAGPVSHEQAMRMLQSLLEDRFQLKWHREPREGQGYGLTIARGGPKLEPAREGQSKTKFGDLDVASMSLDQLCQILELDLGHPVVNRTNLSVAFAIRLRWDSERIPKGGQQDASLPSIYAAVQDQLGLKLEPIRTSVDIFVIDHVELPSGN